MSRALGAASIVRHGEEGPRGESPVPQPPEGEGASATEADYQRAKCPPGHAAQGSRSVLTPSIRRGHALELDVTQRHS